MKANKFTNLALLLLSSLLLTACPKGMCVGQCGVNLHDCRKKGDSDKCIEAYERCVDACGGCR